MNSFDRFLWDALVYNIFNTYWNIYFDGNWRDLLPENHKKSNNVIIKITFQIAAFSVPLASINEKDLISKKRK